MMKKFVVEEINELNSMSQLGRVVEIKPRVILKLLEQLGKGQEIVRLPPPPSQLGSVPVFDALMLVSLLRLIHPKRILEFGTYLGYSTRVFLENTGPECRIISIDLPYGSSLGNESLKLSDSDLHRSASLNDEFLREVQFTQGQPFLEHHQSLFGSRLQLIRDDSRRVVPAELLSCAGGKFDVVFIDGGHDFETIRSDTDIAIKSAATNSLIVWHDYNSQIHQEVTSFLDELSSEFPIRTISGTLIAYAFLGIDPLMSEKLFDNVSKSHFQMFRPE